MATTVSLASDRIRRFAQQFDPDDKSDIELAVSKLVLISHTEFERGLLRLVEGLAKADAPSALFCVRELVESGPYFGVKRDDAPLAPITGDRDTGSEGRVMSMVRNWCHLYPTKLLNHPTIKEMKDRRCRNIVVVDDFVGSGDRVTDFISSMWKSRTIRSWFSLGWIRFSVLAYASTKEAEDRINSSKYRPSVITVRGCPTFLNIQMPASQRKRTLGIFRRYALTQSLLARPLGYGDLAVAMVFEHRCPDNCPAVFWASSGGEAWEPLFPRRSITSQETPLFPGLIEVNEAAVASATGRKRLMKSGALTRRGPIGRVVLLFLSLLARGPRSRSFISHTIGLTISDTQVMIDSCSKWGLLDIDLRLTPWARAELSYAEKAGIKLLKPLSRGDDNYYPKKLRGRITSSARSA